MNKYFTGALAAILMLCSCTNDEIVPTTTDGGMLAVRLHLGGSAKTVSASRAGTIAAEANESAVNTLHAILFDTHEGFAGVVEARPSGADGDYDVLIEKDATYDIWFVANADATLLEELAAIPAETSAKDAVACFQKIYASQAPESTEGFLMRSQTLKRVTTTITKTEDLGTVDMTRLAARFDIVNQAEGVTVTKITFKNRAVKTSLYLSNYMPQEEGWFNTETYTPEGGIVGTKDAEEAKAKAYRHEIYSYRNTSTDPDSVPVLTVEYTETAEGGGAVTREHEIRFTDPNSPAGTPRAISANNLYTITLTKAYKLEFNLSVDDWDEAETFNVRDLPVDLPEDVQDELNRKLLVYDLFAEHNVKSLTAPANGQPATATLYDSFLPSDEYLTESYFSYSDLKTSGLTGNDESSYIYVDGEPYRLPTFGEIMLLSPFETKSPDFSTAVSMPVFGSYTMNTEVFEEKVYLRNGTDNKYSPTEDFSDENVAFKGYTQLKKGAQSRSVYYTKIPNRNDETQQATTTILSPDGEYSYPLRPCYAVRFKGTDQCAAYKWEQGLSDGNGYYHSIKIKALPNKGEGFDVYDIADNVAFW